MITSIEVEYIRSKDTFSSYFYFHMSKIEIERETENTKSIEQSMIRLVVVVVVSSFVAVIANEAKGTHVSFRGKRFQGEITIFFGKFHTHRCAQVGDGKEN